MSNVSLRYQDVLKTLKESEVQQEIKCRAQSHHLQKAEKQIVRLQKNLEIMHDTVKKKEKTIHWWDWCIFCIFFA